MPSSGEIAIPVTVVTAAAIGAAGERSDGAAGAALAAKANGARISERLSASNKQGDRRFISSP